MKLQNILFLALGVPVASWAYSAAPPFGHTGAPGEQTRRLLALESKKSVPVVGD